ncbi:MAG: glycosyltransferase family 4 protein [Planctomycetaceae bacterium]
MISPAKRPLHVVQTSYDDSVFQTDAGSDTVHRQLKYGRILARHHPGSQLTLLTLTRRTVQPILRMENTRFVPVSGRWPGNLVGLRRALSRQHAQNPIDVISTQTVFDDAWAALGFSRRHGIPVVGQIHYDVFSDFARRQELGPQPWRSLRWQLAQRQMKHMQAIRVDGQRTGREVLSRALCRRVAVLPVAVTMNSSEPSGCARDSDASDVLFIGRLTPQKNLFTLLDVAAQVVSSQPSARFQIVGDGPLRHELETHAQSLGISKHVVFHGELPYARLQDFYHASRVFLLPSMFEGLPRVLVEAALHGLPIVASRIGGHEDAIEDGYSGFLCETGDVDGLAARVTQLLSDRCLSETMGQRIRESVRSKFDATRLAEGWVKLLLETATQVA